MESEFGNKKGDR